jgi:hypothetical protein
VDSRRARGIFSNELPILALGQTPSLLVQITLELMMGRTDATWLPPGIRADFFGDGSSGAGSSSQSEQSFAHPFGDLAERCCPHWENAWIDLGGEG